MGKKAFWSLGISIILIVILIPFTHVLKTKWNEINYRIEIPGGYTNDASQLNLTKINSLIKVPNDKIEIQNQLRSIIKEAKEKQLKIAIAGAQHTMGGHTIYPNAIVINMLNYKHMELDTINNILTIGSGALWEDAIRYLDRYQRSIAIMQAFSSFSIGGSISVNGHGWQKDSPPISASLVSFTIMNNKGEILNCSRDENVELFKLVIGGYGLFGIILDIKIKVTSNTAMRYKYLQLPAEDYIENYKKYVLNNPKVELVFGRLRISKKHFLKDATLNFFEKGDTFPLLLPIQKQKNKEGQRLVFRSTVNSEYGKRLRWNLEKVQKEFLVTRLFTRNELLNSSVSLIENKDPHSTDILQEYFIPQKKFTQFIKDIKPVLQNSEIDLLNITIRGVNRDEDSFMNYALEDVFGFVFLFNQSKTMKQEKNMKNLTNKLVDIAIQNNGTFYLPYRLHIDKEKMQQVYPQADTFFKLKKKYDPEEIFYNQFYQHYK